MNINTDIGNITVIESDDGINKGVWVDGVGLVLVEHEHEEGKHVIRVWSNEDEDGDCEYKQIIG